MKERPILFSGEMVRAILDGRKTQTRRVVKPRPPAGTIAYKDGVFIANEHFGLMRNQPYNSGDTLWVRETWASDFGVDDVSPSEFTEAMQLLPVWYKATDKNLQLEYRGRWRPSIHMPRWASRINLRVTGVRVERVQDITLADARAEGVNIADGWDSDDVIFAKWEELWNSINAARPGCSWDANPWVWVVEFEVINDPL
jgi:hypothetical protein